MARLPWSRDDRHRVENTPLVVDAKAIHRDSLTDIEDRDVF